MNKIKVINEKEIYYSQNDTHKGGELIGVLNGAKNGFSLGISEYFAEEFGNFGIHDDQEGFYVLEGSGSVLVGNEEFSIKKGDSFLVPANTKHMLKKDKNSETLKVLWSHGAI
jgi:mannose-6-phosphate isomerase-like protein (cupin superfamily)